ncbi:MAG TPA: HAD family hydrolase [Clostridia bacterium]|nr:HAD family hydrolase [Clostridia bacterium]
MIKTVIFDLDGTLLDTLEDLYQAVSHAFTLYGYKSPNKEEVKKALGKGPLVLMQRLGAKDPELFLEAFALYYHEHLDVYTRPYPGIMELLDELDKKEIEMAVLSNKPHEHLVRICDIYFKDRFFAVMGSGAGFPRKPDPTSLLHLMNKIGRQKNELLYVGDSEVDILTAKKAKCRGLQVSWGFGSLVKDADFIEKAWDLLSHL